MKDLLYIVKIGESILISYFTRHLQRLVKFWQRRKKWEVDFTCGKLILLVGCESRLDLQCPENPV